MILDGSVRGKPISHRILPRCRQAFPGMSLPAPLIFRYIERNLGRTLACTRDQAWYIQGRKFELASITSVILCTTIPSGCGISMNSDAEEDTRAQNVVTSSLDLKTTFANMIKRMRAAQWRQMREQRPSQESKDDSSSSYTFCSLLHRYFRIMSSSSGGNRAAFD